MSHAIRRIDHHHRRTSLALRRPACGDGQIVYAVDVERLIARPFGWDTDPPTMTVGLRRTLDLAETGASYAPMQNDRRTHARRPWKRLHS
jgi:hypothetical protein